LAEKQFVVRVCDSQIRDTDNDVIVCKGKTLLDSGIAQSVENLEVKGGAGDKLLFDYNYGKKVTSSIEDATFRPEFLAIQAGTSIATSLQNYWIFEETVTLSSGSGSVAQTPVGNLYVTKADGTLVTVTPTVKAFTVAGGANTTVKVNYQYNVSVDSITISAEAFPKAYEMTLFTEILNSTGKIADVQIILYKFKPDGAIDLSLKSNASTTSKMAGKCLADDNGNYAIIMIKPVVASTNYIAIATYPSVVTLAGAGATQQLTVYGVRNAPYSNAVIPAASCSFVSGTPATCTVSAGGLLTRAGAGSSIVTITHSITSLTDSIAISAT